MAKHSGPPDGQSPLRPSNRISRIASGLASLSTGFDLSEGSVPVASNANSGPLTAATVEEALRARRLRADFVPKELLSETAWDMLLALLQAEMTDRRLSASDLCDTASARESVACRWIDALVHRGFCNRTPWPGNPDLSVVELSSRGSRALRAYFAELERLPGASSP